MIRELEKKVFWNLEKYGMIEPGDRISAAVSGGADSVCLLRLLLAYQEQVPFSLRVIHVEHGIRGEASLEDAAFVQALCQELAVEVTVCHVDAAGYARQAGLSLEEAARMLRYEVFDQAEKVALAHHREDQAETVLFNLARGTGLRGMGGMRPVRGRYIRPMLEVTRGEIEAYLAGLHQTWREDATNFDPAYTRNRIRRDILPVLTEGVNAQAALHISEAARRAAEAADFLEDMAARFCQAHMRVCRDRENGVRIILDNRALRAEKGILRGYILRRAVCEARGGAGLKDVGEVHIADLAALVDKPRGKHLDLPGRLKAGRVGQTLELWVEQPCEDRARDGEEM